MVAHCERLGWKGAVAVLCCSCWAATLCGLCKLPWSIDLVAPLSRIYPCSGPQSRSQTGLGFPLKAGSSQGTNSCQAGMSGTATCASWSWAPVSREVAGAAEERGDGHSFAPTRCTLGHLVLQPQLFPFLQQKGSWSLSLRQEKSFLLILSLLNVAVSCIRGQHQNTCMMASSSPWGI